MVKKVKKRDGRVSNFNPCKITNAILKCLEGTEFVIDDVGQVTNQIVSIVNSKYEGKRPTVEQIQDIVEDVLMRQGYHDVAKRYILNRQERTNEREKNTRLMNVMESVFNKSSEENDLKRDNANTNTDTAMGMMLKIGSEASKEYYMKHVIKKEYVDAHESGQIHIHDMDFTALTTTCCQIDLERLLKNGFSTGSGAIRPPKSIRTAMALVAIILQSNQNDMHGGQSIGNIDWDLAPYVEMSYQRHLKNNKEKYAKWCCISPDEIPELRLPELKSRSWEDTKEEAYQSAEALIHNLNTMSSRAGAQVPFSSINFGMDTSKEGRLITECLLRVQKAGIGNGDTAIFPILIFRVKDGVNGNRGDPNYDLFELACECAARRLFPCFAFLDAPFNLQFYDPDNKNTHIAYMGCRTRVLHNIYDLTKQIISGRGNLSFTSINLPMIALESKNTDDFFQKLTDLIELCCDQLYDRYLVQKKRKVYNHPFLYGQGVWLGSDTKKWDEEIGDAVNHGTLSLGFIGLAECLYVLIGEHHGQSEEAQKLGLCVVSHMREALDKKSQETNLNYTLLATPAESLAGRALKLTRTKYGVIEGVTDKEYFTNSFHIPPKYEITAHDKIKLEASYHQFCNAGHITYVELDGAAKNNPNAYMSIIQFMKKAGIGYGGINVPLDKCGSCNCQDTIYDECPGCGAKESEGNTVHRIRRITGYLVGGLDRFNDAKRAEEKDRTKHKQG